MNSINWLFKKNLFLILAILFTIPSFFPIIRPGFFPMQDDIQAFRLHQMDKCILDLQIPCRWVPDAGYGYGYPLFEYYPPSVYYLGEIFHLVGFQFIDTVKILFALGFILSALTMYIFLRDLLGEYPALIGSILYTYAPYKAVDVYVRGALSEFWAFVFFPLIFWSSYLLIKTSKIKYIAWLGLSLGLLLMTHNLMSIIFMPVFLIWILYWLFTTKKFQLIFKIIAGGLLGIGLAAFFSLPVFFERQYAHVETLLGGYFDFRQHFVDLYQLFVSNHFGYGSSYIGSGDDLALTAGLVHWLIGLLSIILAIKNFNKFKTLSLLSIVLAVTELGALFMTHQKSSFIWDKVAILSWLQFPWRMLADSVFLLSILGAVAIFFLSQEALVKKIKINLLVGGLVVISLFVLHLSFFAPKEWLLINDQDKFSSKSWDKQLTISIFDYLPIYAKYPPVTKALDLPEVLNGKVDFLSYKKGSNYQIGEINVNSDARLRLPLFDFPNMVVFVDNKKVDFTHSDCSKEDFCLGLITVDVTKGSHMIKIVLMDTPVRVIGNVLTLSSLLFIGLLFFRGYRYEKNT